MARKRLENPVASPPRPLGRPGTALWSAITNEYEIADAAGRELLTLACSALDRAEACSLAIAREGLTVATKGGPKENPLLKIELANRSFVGRTLARLGLEFEAIRPVGRPPGR